MSIIRHIKDHTGLLVACQRIAGQVRLFNLTQVDAVALFDLEVHSQIMEVPDLSILDHAVLTAYARGYQVSLLQSIRSVECEYVFRDAMGTLFSTKVAMSSRPFYGNMTMKARETATAGYVWKETGTPFTTFTREAESRKEAA